MKLALLYECSIRYAPAPSEIGTDRYFSRKLKEGDELENSHFELGDESHPAAVIVPKMVQ